LLLHERKAQNRKEYEQKRDTLQIFMTDKKADQAGQDITNTVFHLFYK